MFDLLGAFKEVRKENISYLVFLPVRMEQLGSQRTDFREIWYWSIFGRFVQKFQFSLRYDKYSGYLTC